MRHGLSFKGGFILKNLVLSRDSRLRFALVVCLTALIAACAPVTYNRYQPAQPMGQGEFKLMASTELAREVTAGASFDLWDQMEDELDKYGQQHPKYQGEIAEMEAEDLMFDFLLLLSGGGFGYPVPNVSIILAYGVTNDIDLELSTTTSLYTRGGAKIRVAKFGRGSLSISPAVGFLPIHGQTDHPGDVFEGSDSYDGYVATLESPLIIGWDFGWASPYAALHLSYHRAKIKFTREITEFDPVFKATVSPEYNLYNVGLALGVQFKFSAFVLTPELVGLYTPANPDLGWPAAFMSPGLAIGAQW